MPTITINRIPAKVSKELKSKFGSRSGYARTALAEKLTRDGRADLAALLQKKPASPASN
jgi:hypothetical protein